MTTFFFGFQFLQLLPNSRVLPREFGRRFKEILMMTAELTTRLENYDKESKVLQISYNHSEDLCRKFLSFSQMLRDNRDQYNNVQHIINQLTVYI